MLVLKLIYWKKFVWFLKHPEKEIIIFSEILAGFSDEDREKFYLDDLNVEDFYMTNASGTYDRRTELMIMILTMT